MELRNKRVTVVGLGKSGLAAALLLLKLGAEPRVTDNEKRPEIEENSARLSEKGIEFELGSHSEDFLSGSELVVTSPGVPDNSFALKWAEQRNIPVISEIELAYSFCCAPIIAVSGTNGKSTVVTLIGEIFKAGAKKACVCGNIGTPFSSQVLSLDEENIVVLEISSFQLERIKSFRPRVSCLLNVTQDHFDRYPGIDQYFNAKKKIFSNQDETDYAILNFDSPKIRALKESIKARTFYFSKYRLPREYDGAYVENGQLLVRNGKKFQWIASREELNLQGDHNLQNCLASVLAGFILGIQPDSIRHGLSGFKALPHRFQTVDVINGVRFIDDSKATNVDSVIKALNCCRAPVILLAGGVDKESDYKPLLKQVKEKIKHLILFGEAREKIAKSIGKIKPAHFVDNLNQAVELAFGKASRGDIVLLSPSCASFDMFKDYKQRGEVFKKAVSGLRG